LREEKNMKKIKYFVEAAIILALSFALISSGAAIESSATMKNIKNQPQKLATLFEEDFEGYEDFALDFPPWTQVDVDGSGTYGSVSLNFTNEYYTGSFIIFNASATDPPANDTTWDTYEGYKGAYCFAATTPPNDDWMITPKITGPQDFYVGIRCVTNDAFVFMVDNFLVEDDGSDIKISFYAKSLTDAYGLERFQVGVSTTDTDPASFEIITEDPYVEAPITWTLFEYTYSFAPELEVNISGGLGLTVTVDNVGVIDATEIPVNIVAKGGLILLGANTSKTIDVAAGESAKVKVLMVGIGRPAITVNVCDMEPIEAKGLLILVLLLGLS
jgi:hypothetical protein